MEQMVMMMMTMTVMIMTSVSKVERSSWKSGREKTQPGHNFRKTEESSLNQVKSVNLFSEIGPCPLICSSEIQQQTLETVCLSSKFGVNAHLAEMLWDRMPSFSVSLKCVNPLSQVELRRITSSFVCDSVWLQGFPLRVWSCIYKVVQVCPGKTKWLCSSPGGGMEASEGIWWETFLS